MKLTDELRLLLASFCMYLMVLLIPKTTEGRKVMGHLSGLAKSWGEELRKQREAV